MGTPGGVEVEAAAVGSSAQGRRWLALAFISLAQFMLVVDDTVVNVALPTIQRDLGFSPGALVWLVSGYVLPFGGFLLLGGRLADLYGRRRLFLLGLALFVVASGLNGIAWSAEMLLAVRMLQGVGAALVSPAGLALVATLFESGRERTKALGVWGGLAGIGLTVGVLLSGVLTDLFSWRWVFLINLPLGLAALAGVTALVPASRGTAAAKGPIDLLGGVTVTAGLCLLLLFLLRLEVTGLAGGAWTLGLAVALLAAFAFIERRAPAPMLPLSILTRRNVFAANLLGFLIPATFFGMFFLLTLHMQKVLHYSPLRAGVSYLGFAVSVIGGLGVCTKLILRFGARLLLTLGMLISAGGLLVFSRLTEGGSYASEILPGMVLLGVGGGWAMVTVTAFALGNLDRSESGLASGLLNSSQQLGGALGLGVIIAIANWQAGASGVGSAAQMQLAGSRAAFLVAAGIGLAGAILAAVLVPPGINQSVDPTLAAAPER